MNLVISLIILVIISGAVGKIVIEKRKGAKCIGCPYSGADTEQCSCD
ncbi:MAG: FeoB-associated Cys-rich membrane protein [Bacillota bacterium]